MLLLLVAGGQPCNHLIPIVNVSLCGRRRWEYWQIHSLLFFYCRRAYRCWCSWLILGIFIKRVLVARILRDFATQCFW